MSFISLDPYISTTRNQPHKREKNKLIEKTNDEVKQMLFIYNNSISTGPVEVMRCLPVPTNEINPFQASI